MSLPWLSPHDQAPKPAEGNLSGTDSYSSESGPPPPELWQTMQCVGDAHTSLGHLISENAAGPRTLGLPELPTYLGAQLHRPHSLSAPLSDSCLQCGPVGSLLDKSIFCLSQAWHAGTFQEPPYLLDRPAHGPTKPRPLGEEFTRAATAAGLEGDRMHLQSSLTLLSPWRVWQLFDLLLDVVQVLPLNISPPTLLVHASLLTAFCSWLQLFQ